MVFAQYLRDGRRGGMPPPPRSRSVGFRWWEVVMLMVGAYARRPPCVRVRHSSSRNSVRIRTGKAGKHRETPAIFRLCDGVPHGALVVANGSDNRLDRCRSIRSLLRERIISFDRPQGWASLSVARSWGAFPSRRGVGPAGAALCRVWRQQNFSRGPSRHSASVLVGMPFSGCQPLAASIGPTTQGVWLHPVCNRNKNERPRTSAIQERLRCHHRR